MKGFVIGLTIVLILLFSKMRDLTIENAQLKNILHNYNIGLPYELDK